MNVNRYHEHIENNSIYKINMSLDDMKNDFENWERCVNILYDNKQTNIEYNEMFNVFGEPSFEDDYDDDYFWILKYKDNLFSVSVSPHGEGSWLDIYIPEEDDTEFYSNIKKNIEDFLEEFYKMIGK